MSVLHAATRARRRQKAATQSQPECDSLAVGLPVPALLAKPAAQDTERLFAERLYHRLLLDGGRRRQLIHSRSHSFTHPGSEELACQELLVEGAAAGRLPLWHLGTTARS